jgi:hypothetical protein
MPKVLVKGNVTGDVGRNLKRGSIVVKGNVGGLVAPFAKGGSVEVGSVTPFAKGDRVEVEDRMGTKPSAGENKPTEKVVVVNGDIKGDLTIETTPEGKDVVVINGNVLGNIEGGTEDVEVRVSGSVIVGEPSERLVEMEAFKQMRDAWRALAW